MLQRTTEVQRRQLHHPFETRCQRRCPSCSDPIVCTHRRRLGTPLAKPPPPATAPCATPAAQHASSSAHSRRSQAIAHSAAGRRCTQRTAEDERRQLRHPSEARCQRRCPSCFDVIACTHRRPSARPSQTPTTRYSPAASTSIRLSPHHATSSAHSRHSQAPAHSAAGRRCMQRTAEVQ